MPSRRTAVKAVPALREVQVLNGRTDSKRITAPEGHIWVFAKANVLGIAANHWGLVEVGRRHLEECLRKHLVLLEDPMGNPAPAKLPPRTCCGYSAPGQH